MRIRTGLAALTFAILATGPALAHTGVDGHVHGLMAGLSHPLSGADHVLAMVAVGLWAGLVGGQARWAWPAAFVGAMAMAGVAGALGAPMPGVEVAIAGSVVALGLAVAFGLRAPLAVGAALCAVFAIAHGLAHGAEMPADASGLAYGAGFTLATALLHGAGLGLAALANRLPHVAARGAGAAVAAAGVALLVG